MSDKELVTELKHQSNNECESCQ